MTKSKKTKTITKIHNPIQYFGGKSIPAPVIWKGLGNDIKSFKDCFSGSNSILAARPLPADFYQGNYEEQINDINSIVINLFRTIKYATPEEIAEEYLGLYAEKELIAKHRHLAKMSGELQYNLVNNINHYNVKLAAMYMHSNPGWIGAGLGDKYLLVLNKVPKKGIKNKLIKLLIQQITAYKKRLLNVQIFCGDGLRMIQSKTQLSSNGIIGIVIDPPYALLNRSKVYAHDDHLIARKSREVAIELGKKDNIRIAYCGYYNRYKNFFKAAGWKYHRWKAIGGYGNTTEFGQGRDNAADECVWFSPNCNSIT